MNELKRLGVTKVYVIGGPTTLSPAVVSALNGQGIATERIAGSYRYETANLLAARVVALATVTGGYSGTAFFARGDAFPDALAVGPVACQARAPIILVQPGFLPPSVAGTIASLNVRNGFVIGSESAVSAGVKSAIDARLVANGGTATGRWSGPNRYATAVAVANGGLTQRWIDLDTLGVATGENFPDALGGGAALGYYGSGLVLTRAQTLPSEVASFLTVHEYEIGRLDVFGGTGTVSDTVKTGIATRLK
jgi:putative cell wall-binding protein